MTKISSKNPLNTVSFFKLYKLASKNDIILIIIGTISAFLNGIMQPLFGQLFGEISSKLTPDTTPDEVFEGCAVLAGYFVLVGSISFILSCCMLYCWIRVGERQAINIRLAYYKSLIQQDIGYFDSINTNELSSKVASDCFKIQQAIGEKLCLFLYTVSMLFGSLIISFLRGWQIALVSCIIIPVAFYSCKFLTWVSNGVVRKTSSVYQEAGGIAEQALSSVRTIKSLNGIEHESQQYTSLIKKAFDVSLKYSVFTGIAYGLKNMLFFFDYSLTFWVGSIFIENEVFNQNMGRAYQFSDILVVFISIVNTSFRLGGATGSIKYFSEAQLAGYEVFEMIERIPQIKQSSKGYQFQDKVKNCQITFENVKFNYPSRIEAEIFKNLNFTLQSNQKTAIVGKSGCGKSTIIQLLERFYDPSNGRILIDDVDIKEFELQSLRKSIGYISQEPVLFGTTIRENLRYANPDATEQDMIEALQKAHIWQFVEEQEKKLDTFVGQSGTQLSGGQKQRICIAREILKKPKILLLDEATSALDTKNEALIQKTLDEVAQGITTIIIAHRLTTIQNVDEIIVIDEGAVVERGTHQQLLENKSHYFDFVELQQQIDLKNDLKINKKSSNENINFQQDLNVLNLERQISGQSTNIFTLHNFNTQNQLGDIELLKQQSSKPLITLQTENCITDNRLDTCDYNQIDLNPINEKIGLKTKQQVKEEPVKKHTLGEAIGKLYSYNDKQGLNAFLGILFSIGNGVAYPFCGWVFGNIASVLLDPTIIDFRKKSNEYSLYFTLIGIVDLLSLTLQYFYQSKVAEKLTFSLRRDLFKKYLSMPISWFDKPANHSAALSLTLSNDCHAVNTLVSTTITFNISNISSLLSAILLGLSADWRTTLVGLTLMPLIVISNIIFAVRMNIFSSKMNQSSEDTAKLINESAINIRTVASLGNPDCFKRNLEAILSKNIAHMNKSAFQAGLAIGLTNLSMFGVYGIIFLSGASFHRDYGVEIKDLLISILCLMFAALGIGKNTEYMGNAGASLVSTNKIFNTLETKDEIQLNIGKIQQESIDGEIIFDNVSFKYPHREGYVLKNISFKIPAKSKVAFVGSSGAGKSSIIKLIQQFYNDYTGKILLDGKDIKQFNLNKYRSYFGVVEQEPILFNGTIKQNIIYNTQNYEEQEIINASKQSNAYSFIQNLSTDKQDGFMKQVGVKGNQISGGQKQRIAISRMILKKPQFLLLDEATSALDSQNEQAIQESLNQVMDGRTSISIAHRISTIKDSDIIFVLKDGNIVEKGDYRTLMEMKNHFYLLQQSVNQES